MKDMHSYGWLDQPPFLFGSAKNIEHLALCCVGASAQSHNCSVSAWVQMHPRLRPAMCIVQLVLFFYPMVAQIPLSQGLSLTFSRKGILRQIYFSLRKQARKAKLLSAPAFFTPPRSKWRILEFCQIFSFSKHADITSSPSTRAAIFLSFP